MGFDKLFKNFFLRSKKMRINLELAICPWKQSECRALLNMFVFQYMEGAWD